MLLPGSEHAVVDNAKVRDYLLSHEHAVGRFKAVFFEALGYSRAGWQRLRRDLLELCQTGVAVEGQASQFGLKYEVRAYASGTNWPSR